MSGREPPRPADPDDWFDASHQAPSGGDTTAIEAPAVSREESGAANDWLDGEPAAARPEAFIAGFTVKLRTLLAVAAIVVGLIILAGLELGGVFSDGGTHPATNPTTAPRSTTSRTPTTPTTPAPPVLSAPTTTLKPGDHGAQVKLLQRTLARLGFPAGAADGIYGSSTQAALMRFQTASGLTADGVLGPRTLHALKLALQRSG